MLREIYIFKGKIQIFKRAYGESISIQALSPILVSLIDFLKEAKENTLEFMNIINFKIAYATDFEHNLLFIFITDLTDDNDNIEQQLEKLRSEFLTRYEATVDLQQDPSAYASFVEVADEVFKELRPKIALVGFSGVGKTTITRLIRAEEIPVKHIPTITGDVATIKLGHINLYLWDFAGQEKYSFVWNKFIKGADSVILILDSSPKNVRESRFFIELIKKEEPHARIAIVANKQDLPESMSPQEIEQYLGYKTYPMVAIDTNNREAMLNILADTVKVRSLIQPFIKPLLERDSLISEAEAAIMAGNIQLAAEKFEQIAQLCVELEEEDLMQHFKAQAQFLQSRLAELQQNIIIPTENIQATPESVESTETVIEPIIDISKGEEVVKKDKAKMEKIMREEEEKRKKEGTEPELEEEKKLEKEEEQLGTLGETKIEEEALGKEEEILEKEEVIKEGKEVYEKEEEILEKIEETEEEEVLKKEEEIPEKEEELEKEVVLEKEKEELTQMPMGAEETPEVSEEMMKLSKEKENLQFKMKLLAKQYKTGQIDEKIFKNVLKKLESQINKLDTKIEKLNAN